MVQDLIKTHTDYCEAINTFEFNLFEFTEKVGRKLQMPFMAMALLKENNLYPIVNSNKFVQFIIQIFNKYKRSVEYHNDLHGSDVAQHCHFIMKTQGLSKFAQFNDFDTLALLVAALCHDVKHDGFNNRYHVMAYTQRFQMYVNNSV